MLSALTSSSMIKQHALCSLPPHKGWFSLPINCFRGTVVGSEEPSLQTAKSQRGKKCPLCVSQQDIYLITEFVSSQKCYYEKCRPWLLLFTSACGNVYSKCICVFIANWNVCCFFNYYYFYYEFYCFQWHQHMLMCGLLYLLVCVRLSSPFCVVFFGHFFCGYHFCHYRDLMCWYKIHLYENILFPEGKKTHNNKLTRF